MLKKFLCLLVAVLLTSILPVQVAFASPLDIEIAPFSSNIIVHGNIRYHYRPHRNGALQNNARLPNMTILVKLYEAQPMPSEHVTLGRIFIPVATRYGSTNARGYFSVTIPVQGFSVKGNLYATVTAIARDTASFVVRHYCQIGDANNAWHSSSQRRTLNIQYGIADIGIFTVPYTSSGAFNIVRFTRQAYDFLGRQGITVRPPRVPIVWNPAITTGGGDNMAWTHINIDGRRNVQTEWNKSTIIHEYGHWAMWYFSEYRLYGGHWYWDAPDRNPIIAFSEGWAIYFGQAPLEPIFENSRVLCNSGTLIVDISSPAISEPGPGSPVFNAAALWGITATDNLNRPFRQSWEAMATTMQNARRVNLGTALRPRRLTNATLLHFYNNYISAASDINLNTAAAYDFWRNFDNNGMQFDSTPPSNLTVTVTEALLPNVWRVETAFWDNIMVSEIVLELNGNEVRRASLDRNNVRTSQLFYLFLDNFEEYVNRGRRARNTITLRAYDHGGNLAITRARNNTPNAPAYLSNFAMPLSAINEHSRFFLPGFIGAISGGLAVIERPRYSSVSTTFYLDGADSVSRVGVVRGSFDNIGRILTVMGIDFDYIPANQTGNFYFLSQFDAIFINCAAGIPSAPLRRFVQEGGLVYASDLSGHSLGAAFPAHFGVLGSRFFGQTRANITDRGLATHMGRNYMDVILPGGAVVDPARLTPNATVYLQIDAQPFIGLNFQPTTTSPGALDINFGTSTTSPGGLEIVFTPDNEERRPTDQYGGFDCCYGCDHHYSDFGIESFFDIDSPMLARTAATIPLSVSFRYGDGRVFLRLSTMPPK